MTMDDPWDDERLQAAFEARVIGHPTPVDLAASTVLAIQTGTARRTPSRRGWPLAAVAAIVVIIGGLAVAGLASRAPDRAAVNPSDITTAPSTATPAPSLKTPSTGVPTQVAGLPVISVTDAFAVSAAGVDDREIAVHGWFSTAASRYRCAVVIVVSPIQMGCGDSSTWLMQDPERLDTTDGNTTSRRAPNGPALNPELEPSGASWMSARPDGGVDAPVEVVFIGHFDDRRSAQCPPGEQAACRGRFVVDRVCWAEGTEVPVTGLYPPIWTPSIDLPDKVDRAVEAIAPDSTILAMVPVDGPQGLPAIEPALRSEDEFGLTGERAVWVVRAILDGRPVTYLVIDGSLRVYEMTASGPVERSDPRSPQASGAS